MLFLAGGYEFAQQEAATPPSRKRLEFLSKAFDQLQHDLLFVTPYEREILAKAGVRPNPTWKGSAKLERHLLNVPGAGKIVVLLLPPLPKGARQVPQNLIHQVENTVLDLRSSFKLVVAMSPWGYFNEQELLKSPGPHPDVLLGSGPGIGITGMLAANGHTVWMRSFSQGKSILRLEVLLWPERNSTFKWTEGQNVRMTLFGLTDQYQENPQMLSLMQKIGTD